MKNLFPGHFKESDIELKKIWNASIFVLDANILLNLYRYSDTTQNEFLRILEKINDRVWLPHRAAEEYLNNRLIVINQQEKSYDNTVSQVKSLRELLDNSRQHPFVSTETMGMLTEVFDKLCEELNSNKQSHTERINNDNIKDAIVKIFENNIGDSYDKDKLKTLIKEGQERYKEKIPPGYKDISKTSDENVLSEECRKYGDFIIWSQVIDLSIKTNSGVIFITDDRKEDWWQIFNGKTIGPHPDLVKEFIDKTGNTFLMYQADRFLELARTTLNEKVSEQLLQEVRETKRKDNFESHNQTNFRKHSQRGIKDLSELKNKLITYEIERSSLRKKYEELKSKLRDIEMNKESYFTDDNTDSENIRIFNKYTDMRKELQTINDMIYDLDFLCFDISAQIKDYKE